jgi:hypothetical protein
MGRRSSRSTGSKLPRSKSMPTVTNKYPVSKAPTVSQQPGMVGTIGQGVALGAGAAIGSSMINGVMNSVSSEPNNKQTQTQNTFSCNNILESFQNCMYSHNDTVLCKPQLDLFNQCVQKNNNN